MPILLQRGLGWGVKSLHFSQTPSEAYSIGLGTMLCRVRLKEPSEWTTLILQFLNRVRPSLLSLLFACFKFEIEKLKKSTKRIAKKLPFCGAHSVQDTCLKVPPHTHTIWAQLLSNRINPPTLSRCRSGRKQILILQCNLKCQVTTLAMKGDGD